MVQCVQRLSWLVIIASFTVGRADAQNLLQELQVPGYSVPEPPSPYQKTPVWDYRFDPQYQSTIKPYLRWYMRYNPSLPGNRVLPRDFGFGLKHGYAAVNPAAVNSGHSNFFSTCTGCGGFGWDNGAGNPADLNNRPSLYWNHLRYLSDVYWNTPIQRRDGQLPNERLRERYRDLYRPSDPTDDASEDDAAEAPAPPAYDVLDSSYRGRVLAHRTIWVAEDDSTGTYSILYNEPPAAVADRFVVAEATIGKSAKIVGLKWADSPSWAENVRLVAGRLTTGR